MKDSLKYIEVRGKMIACGGYDAHSVWLRPYESVTLKDVEGHELHFKILTIPKRLDEQINLDEECTFYILRNDAAGRLVGAVYALEVEGRKLFYRDEAEKSVRDLGMGVTIRGNLLLNPITGTALVVLGSWVAFMLGFFTFSELSGVGVLVGGAMAIGWATYALRPLLGWRRFVGLDHLSAGMKEAGFTDPVPAAKY